MLGLLRRKGKTIDEIAAQIDGAESGAPVTTKSALEISAVLACVDIIASGIAVPELRVMRSMDDGRSEEARNDPIYRLLSRRPNEWQTSFEFRQMLTMHCALTGHAYAIPVRNVISGEVTEIIPVLPQWVTIETPRRYDTRYIVADEFGPIGTYGAADILHLRNMSWDMIKPLNPVRQARGSIGLAMQVEKNMAALHANGGRPSGILSAEGGLSEEALKRLKVAFSRFTSGRERSGTAIVDNNMTYSPIAMTGVDAETMENRRFQIEEICRAFGVFPIMVGHSDKTATYASAEAFFAAHNRRTISRWQRMWAEKLDEFVLDGAGPLYVEFDNQETQLATLRDQGEFYARALGSGGSAPFMTANEVRKLRGLDPIEGGDELREPAASTLAPSEEE